MTEIEKVLRELVGVVRDSVSASNGEVLSPEGRTWLDRQRTAITRAESLLARLSDERPVAWQYRLHFLKNGGGTTEWADCSEDYRITDHDDLVRPEYRALYDRPQLAEVAPNLKLIAYTSPGWGVVIGPEEYAEHGLVDGIALYAEKSP